MISRRALSTQLLGSLTTFGLFGALWSRDLMAAKARPLLAPWFAELAALTHDLRARRIFDLEFQARLEALYREVDVAALVALVDLDDAERRMRLPVRGAAVRGVDLRGLAGLPAELGFVRRLFACRKGRAIVPHGHSNLCSGFLVLRGRWRGRHYDRVESHPDHHVLRPTLDRSFGPGEPSSISDHRDNVHWFTAETGPAFLFNIHVAGHDPDLRGSSGRLYLDPDGEPAPDGTIRAPRMTMAACHAKYG